MTISAALDQATVDEWISRCATERTRTSPPADFPPLPDLAPGRYTDKTYFELERTG